jgi:hypothetical protein
MLFDELPSDVLILCLGLLDVGSLLRLSVCSRSAHCYVIANEATIYQAVAKTHGYCLEQTAGDDGFVG